ncbi:MAG: hypothetical protein ACI9DJ_002398, partial [Algoriphagus sp.]
MDDELGDWILKFRTKAGPKGDMILLADTCYSGTISRGLGLNMRGGAAPLSLSNKKLQTTTEKSKEVFMSENNDFCLIVDDLAPFIVLSASSANEPNYECYGEDFKVYGSLSYAFCKVLSNSGENETYRGFFAKLQLQIKILVENQSPEIGGFPDRKTWAGSSIKSEPYYMVKKLDLSKIEINAGQLHGVLDGSKIELYPVGTYVSENERPTLTGRVTEADLFTATVELDNPLGNSDYWAYVSEKSFGNVIAKIGFMGFESGPLLDTLTAYLKRSPIIRVGEETADSLIEMQNSTQLILRNTSTGATIGKPFRMTRSYSYLAQLKSEIEKLTKSKFLLDFNPHS